MDDYCFSALIIILLFLGFISHLTLLKKSVMKIGFNF